MNEEQAGDLFERFLRQQELRSSEPLARTGRPMRFSEGWAFNYRSRAYHETGSIDCALVGHGLVLVCDDGQIIEGGSLDHQPEQLFKHGPAARIAAARNLATMQARGRKKVRGSKT